MFGNTFDKQLEKTLKINEEHTKERERLKKMFLEEFDRATIITFIDLIYKKGHPVEVKFIETFKDDYDSGNYDEVEIKEFKSLTVIYKSDLIDCLNRKED